MKAGRGAKELTRIRIRTKAAALLRRDGLSALSVRRAMRAAGLTVGGFYAHYGTRNDLVRDAFLAAVEERRPVVDGFLRGVPSSERLETFVQSYLSNEHVDAPASGCPWGAVLSELPRSGMAARKQTTELFDRSVNQLHPDRPASIATLLLAFASLAAMRAVVDVRLREEIADAAVSAVRAIGRRSSKGRKE